MAKRHNRESDAITAVAEAAGRALGQVAGAIDSLQAQHPHPVTEVQEALAARVEKIATVASDANARKTAVKRTKAALRRARKKTTTRTRRKAARMLTATKRAAKQVVKRAKKIVRRASSRKRQGQPRRGKKR